MDYNLHGFAMRYAIVSDIHANWQAWCAVRDDLLAQNVDMVVCLGDVIGYGPAPARVLADVRKYCNNFVLGNHDAATVGLVDLEIFNDDARRAAEWTTAQLDDNAKQFLREWPLVLEDQRGAYVHAEMVAPDDWGYVEKPADVLACLRATNKQLVFVGHTHRPAIHILTSTGELVHPDRPAVTIAPGTRYLINVGSVGDPRDGTALASYCLCDLVAGRISLRQVPFDTGAFRQELQQHPELGVPWFLQQQGVATAQPMSGHAVRATDVAKMRTRPPSSRGEIKIVAKKSAPVPAAPAEPVPAEQPARRSGVGIWLAGLLIVALIALGGGAAWYWKSRSSVAPLGPVAVRNLPQRFELRAENATIHGKKLQRETKYGAPNIGFWSDLNDYVTWPVTNAVAGEYQVSLEYSINPGLRKSTIIITSGAATLTASLSPTGGWGNFSNTVLGPLVVPAGPTTITMKGTGKANDGVMNLRSLEFRPISQ